MLYMVTWIPSIYPSHVNIYTSTMDPSWVWKNKKFHGSSHHQPDMIIVDLPIQNS